MRFLSKYARATFEAIRAVEHPLPNGKIELKERGVMVEFREGAITDSEFEMAKAAFIFNGGMLDLDERTDITPRFRVGLYDTDVAARNFGWDARRKHTVEEALLSVCAEHDTKLRPVFGSVNEHGDPAPGYMESGEKMFILAQEPRVPAPWPNYDQAKGGGRGITTAEFIVRKVREDGYDPEAVAAYERQNGNRDDVLAALEALTDDGSEAEADEPVEVMA